MELGENNESWKKEKKKVLSLGNWDTIPTCSSLYSNFVQRGHLAPVNLFLDLSAKSRTLPRAEYVETDLNRAEIF